MLLRCQSSRQRHLLSRDILVGCGRGGGGGRGELRHRYSRCFTLSPVHQKPTCKRTDVNCLVLCTCMHSCVCVCACTRMGRRVWVCVHAGVCVRVCMPAVLSARVTRNQPATTRFAYNNVHDTVVIAANASNCFTCG